MQKEVTGTLFDPPLSTPEGIENAQIQQEAPVSDQINISQSVIEVEEEEDLSKEAQQEKVVAKKVTRVMIFYDDATFHSFDPSK